MDLAAGHFARILLDVLEPLIVDLAELRPLLVELDVEEGVLFGEIEGVVGGARLVGRHGRRDIVAQLGGVFFVVIVMIVVVMVPFLSHDNKINKLTP